MTLPHAVPSVVFQKLDEGAVLFAAETELYFGLNDVGALIWSLLPPASASFDALCEQVGARFPEVDLQQIRRDVQELLEHLDREGLVRPAAADDEAAHP